MLTNCLKKLGSGIDPLDKEDLEKAFKKHLDAGLSEYDAGFEALADHRADIIADMNDLRQQVGLDALPTERPSRVAPVDEKVATQTDTPEFKKWFGDSVVVDADGNPLRVYRGDVRENDGAALFFTSDAKTADGYAEPTFVRGGNAPHLTPAYLSIQNPLVIDALGKRHDNIPVPWEDWKPKVFGNLPKNSVSVANAYRYALEHGHDGLIVKNVIDTANPHERAKPSDVYAVKDRSQIKSAIGNRGTFDPNEDDITKSVNDVPGSSVSLLTDIPKAKKLLGLPKSATVRQIGEAFDRQAEKNGTKIALDDRSEDARNRIARGLVTEAVYQLQTTSQTGTGLGWYSNNFPAAVQKLGDLYPEFKTHPETKDVFTAVLAITSNGERVSQNLANAIKVYDALRDGAPGSQIELGTARQAAFRNNMRRLENLLRGHGAKGMRDALLSTVPVREVNATLRAMGEPTVTGYQAHVMMPMAAIHFGPKLGAFCANLMGSEGYLTMDLWWSRTFNRHRGQLAPVPTDTAIQNLRALIGDKTWSDDDTIQASPELAGQYLKRNYNTQLELMLGRKEGTTTAAQTEFWDMAKANVSPRKLKTLTREHRAEKIANSVYKAAFKELNEAPFNSTDRTFMIQAATAVQAMLEKGGLPLSIADIQAALWYYEKRLYAALGKKGKADDVGYEEAILAAADSVGSRGPATRNYLQSVAGEARPARAEADDFLKSATEPAQDLDNLGFYSQAARTIAAKMPNKASAAQVRGILSPANGVKLDELKWLDIDSFLDENPNPSKQQVLDYIKANGTPLKEVTYGDASAGSALKALQQAARRVGVRDSAAMEQGARNGSALTNVFEPDPARPLTYYRELKQAYEDYRDAVENEERNRVMGQTEPTRATQYEAYVLPGGEPGTYREVLLTLPVPDVEVPEIDSSKWRVETTKPAGFMSDQRDIDVYDENGERLSRRSGFRGTDEEAIRDVVAHRTEQARKTALAAVTYRSPHWAEPNVLAHIRFDDRTVDGKKVLHIAEVQSDWHQAGRKKGYATGERNKRLFDAAKEFYQTVWRPYHSGTIDGKTANERFAEIADKSGFSQVEVQNEAAARGDFTNQYVEPGVPDAPFKTSWSSLAMKRMIRYAAENGYDALSWDTGETSADRYDLSKQVSYITYAPVEKTGNIAVDINLADDFQGISLAVDPSTGTVVAGRQEMVGKQLEDVVGKEVAEKILTDQGHEPDESMNAEPGAKALWDMDLKVGGEGMVGFYDKILPAEVNKYVKKWGAKVTPGSVFEDGKNLAPITRAAARAALDRGERVYALHGGPTTGYSGSFSITSLDRLEPSRRVGRMGKGKHDAHTVAITPAMKESVMTEGQPLFSRGTDVAGRKNAHTSDALVQMSGGKLHPTGEVEGNDWDMEMFRRVIEAYKKSYPGSESSFNGITIGNATMGRVVQFYHNELRPSLLERGFAEADLKPLDQFMQNAQQMMAMHPTHSIFWSDPSNPAVRWEEVTHRKERELGGVTAEAQTQLENHPLFTDPGAVFASHYGAENARNRVSEIAAKLITGQAEKYGWTSRPEFEAEKKSFLQTWADGVIDNARPEIEDMSYDEFVRKYQEIADYASDPQTSEARGRSQEQADSSSGEVRGGTSPTEGDVQEERQARDQTDQPEGTAPPSGTDNGNGLADGDATPDRGVSRAGERLENEAVAEQLSSAFGDTAGYDKVTVEDQTRRATDLVQNNPALARAIMEGRSAPPEGLRAMSVFVALKEHAKASGDADLIAELARSPLTSQSSIHAQEMRMLREAYPNDPVALVREIQKTLDANAASQPADGTSIAPNDAKAQLRQVETEYQQKLTELEQSVAARAAELAERQTKEELDRILGEPRPSPYVLNLARNAVSKLDREANAARDRLKASGFMKSVDDFQKSVDEPSDITQTENFKLWFGDSKVVDADGKPLKVYHGTNQNVEQFSKDRRGFITGSVSSKVGFFFTEDAREAGEYAEMSANKQPHNAPEVEARAERLSKAVEQAERRGDWDQYERLMTEWENSESEAIHGDRRGQNLIPAYLSIQNPMVVDFNGSVDLHAMTEHIAEAKGKGHDGLKMLNVYDPVAERPELYSTTQWVAFEPTQIKSATGNNGNFDPNEDSILKSTDEPLGDSTLSDLAKVGASHIARLGTDPMEFRDAMLDEFGAGIEPHIDQIYEAAKQNVDAAAGVKLGRKLADTAPKGTVLERIAKTFKRSATADLSPLVRQLARSHVEAGAKDRHALVNAVHKDLMTIDPMITRRETMDMISGYGKYRQLSKDQIAAELRDLSGQLQQVAKLEDMAAGQAPKKTGSERRQPSDEERRLIQKVEEEKKKGGYNVTDPATQLRTALGAVKTRLRNQITDLDDQIRARKKIVKTRTRLAYDPEALDLARKRDELKKQFNEVFGPTPRTPMSDEQRLRMWKTRAERRTKELQEKLANGDYAPTPKRPPVELGDAERKAKADLDVLNERIRSLRDLAGEVTPEVVQTITDLSAAVDTARQALVDADGNPINRRKRGEKATDEELAYGRAMNDLDSYVTSQKLQNYEPRALTALKKLWEAPRNLITIGHGGVIPFTHGRNSAYTPGEGKMFWKAVARAYSYTPYGRQEKAMENWEKDMADLRGRPLFDFMAKAGLDIRSGSHPVGMGSAKWTSQSFDALKGLRADLFEQYWDAIGMKPTDPGAMDQAKEIAKIINHSTGTANVPPVVSKIASKVMFAPKLRFAKYANVVDAFRSKLGFKRVMRLVALNVGLLVINDLVNRYIFGQTGHKTVNWTDPTQADWLRGKVAGMTVPMAPVFETLRLPFRAATVMADPNQRDKGRVLKTEFTSALHPAINLLYGGLTGEDMVFGEKLPFRGVSQYIYGEHRHGRPMNAGEYVAGKFIPIPAQPVAKEMMRNGVHLDSDLATAFAEGLLSGGAGMHIYEQQPKKK